VEAAIINNEHKPAEEKLKEAQERYLAIFNRSRDAVYMHDFEGHFIDANDAALKLLGYDKDEITSLNFTDLLTEGQLPLALRLLVELKDTGSQLERTELRLRRKDGSLVSVETNESVIYQDGKPSYCIGIGRDITERNKVQEELKQSYENLQKAMLGAVQAISMISEVRDPYTAGHQLQVARLASAIAAEMGLPEKKITALQMAGTLHDIGKINIPSEILSKPGRLNQIEFDLIKTHPGIGREILKSIDFPWPICRIVSQHHERLDGSGYPSSLKDDEICIEAKILAVADVVSAMSCHRPYRPALGVDQALEEIVRHRGIFYDPASVDACYKLFKEKGFKLEG